MITAKEALKQHKALKRVWTDESKLSQAILISILAHLENPPKTKRTPSAYNKFFAREARKGLGAREIAAKWNEQKK